MKKLKYILLCVFILTAASVFAVNVTIPQATGYGVIPRGNANGTYTPVATSTLFGYTPLSQSLYYATTTFTSLTTAPNLSITKSQVSDFGGPYLTSADITGLVPYTGATTDVNLGAYKLTTDVIEGGSTNGLTLHGSSDVSKPIFLLGSAVKIDTNNSANYLQLSNMGLSGSRTYTFPDSDGVVCTTATCAPTTYTATYPVTLTGSAFGLAFGTTTSNTWAGTQSFTNTANFNTWTNNGSATTTNLAITALTGLLVGNGSTKPISTAVSGTDVKTINSTSIIGSGDITVQPTLVSGTNIKTINGSSILGSGDLTVTGGSGLSSSSPWTVGNVAYVTGNSTLGSTATGTVSSGTGISVTAGQSIIGSGLTITNTAPDQTVVLNNGTGISVTGTYPNFTITNTGSTFAFPWTVNNGYNSTSTVIGFTGGLFSTASSTFSSALRLPSLSQGSLYVGSTGLVNSVATSAPTVTAPITYSGTLGAFVGGTGGAFDCTSANGSTKGCLTGTDWTTFNNKQATISTTFPITLSGATVGFGGLSTSSTPTIGQMPYWTGVNTFGSVATTTATCAGTVSCTTFTILGSTPITLTGSSSGGTGNVSTSTNETNGQLSYWTTTSGTPAKLGSVATTTLTATGVLSLSNPISVIGGTPSVLSCTTASSGVGGCLSNTMYDTFNNKVSTARTINTTYPILGGGDLSVDRTFSLAFGTTTNNIWSGTNTFTGNASTTLLSAANLFVNAIQATSTTQNSVFLNNYIGFGTTTPKYDIQISSSTAPQLTLTGTDTDPGISLRSVGGHLYIASTSPTTFATSTTPAIDINTSVGTSPGLAIGTTSQTRILNLGSDPSTTAASTTIRMQKLQFEGLNSAGTMSCTYLVGTSWVVQAGTCN